MGQSISNYLKTNIIVYCSFRIDEVYLVAISNPCDLNHPEITPSGVLWGN